MLDFSTWNQYSRWGVKGGWLTFWVTVACTADMTLFGYDQGVFGGVIVTDDFLTTLHLRGPLHTSMLGTVTAIYDVGCFFGAISAVYLGEKLGRKNSILWGTLTMAIGGILQVSASTVPHMITGRIISGLGNGINTATAPTWQGETSQAKWRGKLVVLEMVFNIGGYSLSNWITLAFSYLSGPISWRFPLAFQFFFILIIFATVPWLPESPRWLIQKDRFEEATRIVADLESKEVNDARVLAIVDDIRCMVVAEAQQGASWLRILTGSSEKDETSSFRRLILGITAQAMSQLSGINVTSYYLPTVLIQSVGLSHELARLLTACNSISYLIAGCFSVLVIERLGRRKLLLTCAAGQSLCYLMITVLLRFNEKSGLENEKAVASASVGFFFAYYLFFGLGFQSIPWLYPVEINSLAMRTKGTALSSATNWAFNFMVVEVTPVGIQNLKWKFYIIWTVLNASFVPIAYFFFPETAGRSLEDVDRYFRENSDIFVHRIPDATSRKRPEKYSLLEADHIAEQGFNALKRDHIQENEPSVGHEEILAEQV
ncbi:unnamed protein product [Penicillium salamii]|nr:unnamed protein product [Penicillium salamii]